MKDSIFQRLMSTEEGKRAYCREDLLLKVAQLMIKIMKEKHITQKELAERAGVTKGHISQLLNGSHNMTLATVSDLFYSLGCKITLEVSACTVKDFADALICPQAEWERTTWRFSTTALPQETMPTHESGEPETRYKYKLVA